MGWKDSDPCLTAVITRSLLQRLNKALKLKTISQIQTHTQPDADRHSQIKTHTATMNCMQSAHQGELVDLNVQPFNVDIRHT